MDLKWPKEILASKTIHKPRESWLVNGIGLLEIKKKRDGFLDWNTNLRIKF